MTAIVIPINADTKIPDFITRVDISQMNDAQLDDLVNAIKTRRMSSFIVYQQTVADKEQAASDKALIALDKEMGQILKVLNTIDGNIEKLETRINKVRGLRIQAGLNVI